MLAPKIWHSAVTGAAVALLSWFFLDLWLSRGGDPPGIPKAGLVLLAVLPPALLITGLPVRRWNRGDRTRRLNPLRAAQVAMFAVSATWVGALLAGWYLGQVLSVLPLVEGSRAVRLSLAVAGAVLSIALSAAGHLVKRWCTLPPDDLDGAESSNPG